MRDAPLSPSSVPDSVPAAHLGRALQLLRQHQGLSLDALAACSGCDVDELQQLEAGGEQAPVSALLLGTVANGLGITLHELALQLVRCREAAQICHLAGVYEGSEQQRSREEALQASAVRMCLFADLGQVAELAREVVDEWRRETVS